jgi:mannosyltransferase OCH1-like enzyme
MSFHSSSKKTCSTHKNKFLKIFKEKLASHKNKANIEVDYYKLMGEMIQSAHESKKIDIFCRAIFIQEFRTQFIKYINKNAPDYPTLSELSYYNKYSEYSMQNLKVDFNTARYLKGENVSFDLLDNFASRMDVALSKKKQDHDNIPKIINSIWLTSHSNPKELLKSDIENIIYNKKFFNKLGVNYSHIVWTNDKTLIAKSVKLLEQNGIEVHSIDEIKSEIGLFDKIIDLTEQKKFGMASDILRYEIINIKGGIYADLNFRFKHNIETYLKKYDFITIDAQNNFFAAKPHHKIMQNTLESVMANLQNPPAYMLATETTIPMTHIPYVVAIIKDSNKDDNVDFYSDYYYSWGMKEDIGRLGDDNYSSENTWIKNEL